MQRSPTAESLWSLVYGDLRNTGEGLAGALCSRAEAQCLRLSMIYALLRRSLVIDAEDILAALAVWDYSQRSVRHIFGESSGDETTDEVYAMLSDISWTDRTEISEKLGRHKKSSAISQALYLLHQNGRVVGGTLKTKGRPREVWKRAPEKELSESVLVKARNGYGGMGLARGKS